MRAATTSRRIGDLGAEPSMGRVAFPKAAEGYQDYPPPFECDVGYYLL